MSRFEPTEEFANWARSLAGIDGGNMAGPIWFCGIEHGGNDDDIKTKDFKPVNKLTDWVNEIAREKNFGNPFDQKALKLYAALLEKEIAGYKDIAEVKGAFAPNSDVFKLNLYPLAFKNTADGHWSNEFFKRTRIPTKEIYRVWCQNNRFELFKNWVSENEVTLRLIICTGLDHQLEFLMAFGSEDAIHIKMENEKVSDPDEIMATELSFRWAMINNDKTVLAVVPFFGHWKYCLKSDGRIKAFGKRIREICRVNIGWIPKTADKS